MRSKTAKIKGFLRNLAWTIDYGTYLFASPYKFKKKPETFKNILIIEMLYIGDLIVITPTIRAVKKAYPEAKITVMTQTSMRDVLTENPNVDEVMSYTNEEINHKFNRIANTLKNKYDLAIILHPGIEIGSYRMSKLLLKARIPFRIGCTKVGILEGKGYFLNRETKPTFKLKHKIEDNLDVIKTIGIQSEDRTLELHTTNESDEYIKDLLKTNSVSENAFIAVIHAAPQHKTHRWIDERFAKIADQLIEKYNAKIVFTGNVKDFITNADIIQAMKYEALNLAGQTNIKQFFSLIKRANFVISVDTSAMHAAAAFNKPTISLFGAGDPNIWRPYSEKALYIIKDKEACTSCMKHKCGIEMECMKAIKTEEVMKKIEELLK